MSHSPLLLQLVVILGTARLLAFALRFVGQPPVIGEMLAGIVLGPIVFGALAPSLHAQVFAPASLPALDGLSQVGLVLFMFIVGAELRLPERAPAQLTAAGWIASMLVLVPMTCGVAVAVLLYPRFAPAGVNQWTFCLFMASAMSITAFPIMARILKERGMTHTVIGRLSLTAAAMADVLAWVMLAVVVVVADASKDWNRLWQMLAGLTALSVAVFTVARPILARLLGRAAGPGADMSKLAMLFIGTFACAYATKALGVHPVFGAFLFGAALPRDDLLLASLIERVEHVAIIVLMPIFFALAGLGTTPAAFVGTGLAALLWVLVAAVAGKVAVSTRASSGRSCSRC
jgi:Kef-type K+ transport system membrane component KefB